MRLGFGSEPPIGCKRLCVDSGYYASFNRPKLHLVDVSQAPIEARPEAEVAWVGHVNAMAEPTLFVR